MLRLLLPYLKPHLPLLGAGLGLLVVQAAAMLAVIPVARLAGIVFGDLARHDPEAVRGLTLIGAAAIGLYFAKGVAGYLHNLLVARVGLQVVRRIRSRIFGAIAYQDPAFLGRFREGDLISRVTADVTALRDALVLGYAELLPSALILAGAIAYTLHVNWRLAALTLLGLPLVGLALSHFGRSIGRWSLAVHTEQGALLSAIGEHLAHLPVVKAFGREDAEQRHFEITNERYHQAAYRGARIYALQGPLIAFLQTCAIAAVLWVGGREVYESRLAMPDLLAFGAAVGVSLDPVIATSNALGRIQQAAGASARVRELLDAPLAPPDATGALRPEACAGHLAFDRVTFAYAGNPVLSDLSFEARPGEIVALVGPSGGGKSTVLALALRLHDPGGGAIRLDGRDVRDLSASWLRSRIGFVPQDPAIFFGSIEDNIRFGKPDATRLDIEEACRTAGALEFVAALPDGYRTQVGERGEALSGGQRQRLAIARALVRDPRILLFDEATSALDPDSEGAIRDALLALRPGRTILLVTHRPSLAAIADRTLVLAEGRLAPAEVPA